MNLLNEEQFCSISPRGDTAAWCTSDGVIKFYDCMSGAVKLEYSSSAHLKGVCTCIEWTKSKESDSSVATKKKAKTSSSSAAAARNELSDPNLIALGTSEGSVLIYHLAKAALHTIMQDDSVTTKVNDLFWASNHSIYSCSDDGQIMEWRPTESKLSCKWKASKTAITSILVDSKSEYILAASRSIAIWDLATKTKLKTLTGHSNDIFKLLNLNNRITSNNETQLVNDYYISAALNDRVINTWMLLPFSDISQSSTSALLSFSVNDSPIYMDVVNLNIKDYNDTVAMLIVITSRGALHLYVNDLVSPTKSDTKSPKKAASSGTSGKPIKQLTIESKENVTLKINAAYLSSNSKNERLDSIDLDPADLNGDLAASVFKSLVSQCSLVVVYGATVSPRIEKLGLDELSEAKTRLVREDPGKVSVSVQVQNTKIETAAVSKDLQVLVPSMVGPQVGNALTSATNNKRKSNETNQMTLEEKLDLLGINNNEGTNGGDMFVKGGHLPKTDNLLVLLVQGLQSNDSKTLNHVLQHKNEKVINKTVSLLPTQYIMSLIKELTQRLQGHAQSGLGMVKWLKAVLMIHTSYLMSYPDLIDSLGKLYESMNARTKLFPQLSKLQGKLKLAISQISSANGVGGGAGDDRAQADEDKDHQELLYYQESTSEDEQIEDDLIPSHSEEYDPAADEFLFSDEEEDSTQEETGVNANS